MLTHHKLGNGAFGQVRKGNLLVKPLNANSFQAILICDVNLAKKHNYSMVDGIEQSNQVEVTVKMLPNVASEKAKRIFLQEMNIVKFYQN